jgi:hypothetical protein
VFVVQNANRNAGVIRRKKKNIFLALFGIDKIRELINIDYEEMTMFMGSFSKHLPKRNLL